MNYHVGKIVVKSLGSDGMEETLVEGLLLYVVCGTLELVYELTNYVFILNLALEMLYRSPFCCSST